MTVRGSSPTFSTLKLFLIAKSGLLLRSPARTQCSQVTCSCLSEKQLWGKRRLTIATFHQRRLRNVEAQRRSWPRQFATNSEQLFGPVTLHRLHVEDGQVVPEHNKNYCISNMYTIIIIRKHLSKTNNNNKNTWMPYLWTRPRKLQLNVIHSKSMCLKWRSQSWPTNPLESILRTHSGLFAFGG